MIDDFLYLSPRAIMGYKLEQCQLAVLFVYFMLFMQLIQLMLFIQFDAIHAVHAVQAVQAVHAVLAVLAVHAVHVVHAVLAAHAVHHLLLQFPRQEVHGRVPDFRQRHERQDQEADCRQQPLRLQAHIQPQRWAGF